MTAAAFDRTEPLARELARVVGASHVRVCLERAADLRERRPPHPPPGARPRRAARHARRSRRGGPGPRPAQRPLRAARRRHRALRRRARRPRRGVAGAHPPEPHPRDRSEEPPRRGRAGGRERPPLRGRRTTWAALRPRSVEPDGLHHRRQRGRERGRAALPEVRRDDPAHPGARGRPRRRLASSSSAAGRRAVGTRPRRVVRRLGRQLRRRDPHHRPPDAHPPRGADPARRLLVPARGRARRCPP